MEDPRVEQCERCGLEPDECQCDLVDELEGAGDLLGGDGWDDWPDHDTLDDTVFFDFDFFDEPPSSGDSTETDDE